MQDRSSKRPRDPNQLAKLVVDLATGDHTDARLASNMKNAAAVLLGRQGGLKGGRARANSLTAERRSEIARKAATSRWKSDDDR